MNFKPRNQTNRTLSLYRKVCGEIEPPQSRRPLAILNEEQNAVGEWTITSGIIHGEGATVNVNILNDTAYISILTDIHSDYSGNVYNLTNIMSSNGVFEIDSNNRFWIIPFDTNTQSMSGNGEEWHCLSDTHDRCECEDCCELKQQPKGCLECKCVSLDGRGDCDLYKKLRACLKFYV